MVMKMIKQLPIILLVIIIGTCSQGKMDSHKHEHKKAHLEEHDEHSDKHGEPCCGHDKHEEHGEKHDEHHDEHHHHHGHGSSDLDRTIEELTAQNCEHKMKAYLCDQCRYEVGVVKAPEKLFNEGLLKKAKVRKQAIAAPLKLTGKIHFDDRRVAHLSTQTKGIIKKVHVALGDRVKKNQALISIDSIDVGEAEANYLEAQGMLKLAKSNHDRIQTLRKEGISSEKELHIAKQKLDAAQIQHDAALGKLIRLGKSNASSLRANRAKAKGRLVLRSPVDGIVLKMHAVAGEIAHTESSLITVGDNMAMWVWADLYERHASLVLSEQAKKALNAIIKVKAFPDEEFAGKLDFISPSIDEKSRTIKVRIAVPNSKRRLLAGMFAHIEIYIPKNEKALTVAKNAILEDEGRKFIFIYLKDDYYIRRPVKVGRVFAQYAEILQGIKEIETIVSNGSFLMKSDVLRSKMGAGCAD